ncbi:cytochrome P450 [Xylariales sp. PMI_506]|nr:cytochrome P450 [Xylariales sp. PMI_506]
MPIATLPMLGGKMYVAWSPSLIHSAMRHKNLTFDETSLQFAQRIFGLSNDAMSRIRGSVDHTASSMSGDIMAGMKTTLMGQPLYRMNVTALKYVASILNSVNQNGFEIPDVYLWLRKVMTLATAEGLYGAKSPLRDDPSLLDNLWLFDSHIRPLFLGFLPNILARTAYSNREKLQAALMKYYGARLDENEDVAEVTKLRARVARDAGISNEDLGRSEAALLFVATTNTIPTLYWFFVNVWLRPDVVEKARQEVSQVVEITALEGDGGAEAGRRKAVLDITLLEVRCPLLVSCYREAIRLGNQAIGNRYVMEDTILTDDDGTQYLLKKDNFLTWSVKAMHLSTSVWEDANSFHPERFVPSDQISSEQSRKQKLAYVPFGGGKHLCPGRNFAFAENLGFLASLVSGFDVVGLDETKVRMGSSLVGEAVAKPPADAQGGSISIKRREGWEDVEWSFKC